MTYGNLNRRLSAMEADKRPYLTIGELLDRLGDKPVDDGRVADPRIAAALDQIPSE